MTWTLEAIGVRLLLLAVLACAPGLPARATAGVTIQYSGTVATPGRVGPVLRAAEAYARKQKWQVTKTDRGIALHPAEWCEPIHLQFDGSVLAKDFVKTQFAGAAVHRDVVRLFRVLKPLMATLEIGDEGEYWETGDPAKLEAHMAVVNTAIDRAKARQPNARGPVRLPNGRIVDLEQ